jgi:hypothetical protein
LLFELPDFGIMERVASGAVDRWEVPEPDVIVLSWTVEMVFGPRQCNLKLHLSDVDELLAALGKAPEVPTESTSASDVSNRLDGQADRPAQLSEDVGEPRGERFRRLRKRYQSHPLVAEITAYASSHDTRVGVHEQSMGASDEVLQEISTNAVGDSGFDRLTFSQQQQLGSALFTLALAGWLVGATFAREQGVGLDPTISPDLLFEHAKAELRAIDVELLDDLEWYCFDNFRGPFARSIVAEGIGRTNPEEDDVGRHALEIGELMLVGGLCVARAHAALSQQGAVAPTNAGADIDDITIAAARWECATGQPSQHFLLRTCSLLVEGKLNYINDERRQPLRGQGAVAVGLAKFLDRDEPECVFGARGAGWDDVITRVRPDDYDATVTMPERDVVVVTWLEVRPSSPAVRTQLTIHTAEARELAETLRSIGF